MANIEQDALTRVIALVAEAVDVADEGGQTLVAARLSDALECARDALTAIETLRT